MTIFDVITGDALATIWETLAEQRQTNELQEFFPDRRSTGISLKWITGRSGLPVVLRNSAFDVHVIPRPRATFDEVTMEMPFFKESKVINEELRQELLRMLQTGNAEYIAAVTERIFDDQRELVEAAAATRERMRGMILSTGVVAIANNGQNYDFDYGLDAGQMRTAAVPWTNAATAQPIQDMQDAVDHIESESGTSITRGLLNKATMNLLRAVDSVKNAIFVFNNFANATLVVTNDQVQNYISSLLGINFKVVSGKYRDEDGNTQDYFPYGIVTLLPDGAIGNTWFGTTPEEADLMNGMPDIAAVSIVDTGVAITVMKKADPVNVETKVSMVCLPSAERIDEIVILSVV